MADEKKYVGESRLTNIFSWIKDKLNTKQDTLTAGDNISIVDNVISTTGGDIRDELWKRDRPYFVFIDDDGREEFKNIYTNILKPRNIKAGLSICFSDYLLGSTGYLSVAELKEYEAQGNDILCHSTSIDTLIPNTADAVLRYCISQLKKYEFSNNGIFVYPNGNIGEDRIAIEEITSNYFNYGINVNYEHNCPVKIPIDNKLNIGRIFINSANLNTDSVKQYISEIINDTFEKNKLLIISTHSNKCDTEYLAEVLDTIINRGGIFESPVTVFKDLERTYVEAQLDVKADKTENAEWLKSKNLLDYNGLIHGQYDQENEGVFVPTNARCTPKYNVEPNSNYYISNVGTVRYHYWNGNIYLGSEVISNEGNVVVPNNANLIAFHGTVEAFTSQSQLEKGTSKTPYTPYSMSNVALTPYAQTQSNRNLLDNPWFTVNQRGQSSYGGGVYTVDRWKTNLYVSLTVGNGVTLAKDSSDSYGILQQYIYADNVRNKNVTLSLMLSNGHIYSVTDFIPKTLTYAQSYCVIEMDSFKADVFVRLDTSTSTLSLSVRFYSRTPNDVISVRAIKLELGSISTLANDVAPNYADELLKCQFSKIDHTDTYANKSIPVINTMGQVELFHNSSMDWNEYRKPGLYRVGDLTNYSNYPAGAGSWGQLIVSTGGDTTAQIYIPYATADRMYYRCFSHSNPPNGTTWVAMSTTATKVARNGNIDTPMTFNWSGQGGQPTWLWGGNDADPSNMYVYNPSNFNVRSAQLLGDRCKLVTSGIVGSNESVDINIKNDNLWVMFIENFSSSNYAFRSAAAILLSRPTAGAATQTSKYVNLGITGTSSHTITCNTNGVINFKSNSGYTTFFAIYQFI